MSPIEPSQSSTASSPKALLRRSELAPQSQALPASVRLGDRFSPAQAMAPTALKAKAQGEALLSGMSEGQETAVRSRVVLDRLDVGAALSPTAKAALKRELQANQAQAQAVLAELGPQAQAQHAKLEAAMKDHEGAALALQILLLEGKLGPGPSGEATLKGLEGLLSAPLAPGLPRQALLQHAALELAHPHAIAQKAPQTCVATSLQAMLAMAKPEEYLRLLTGLASPKGEVRLANGEAIAREPGTDKADDSQRSWPTQLMSPAFMEYANGELSYDAKHDRHSDGSQGLSAEARKRLLEGLMNAPYRLLEGRKVNFRPVNEAEGFAGRHATGAAGQRPSLIQAVNEAMATSKEPFSVALEWDADDEYGQRHGGHALLLLDINEQEASLLNPWGYLEVLPRLDFDNRLRSILIPQANPKP